jgi:predicted PurR-regulated permease PerM
VNASSISVRLIAKIFLVVIGLAALFYLVYLSRRAIGLVVISAFLAVALGPPVDFFDRMTRLPRWLSILLVYLIAAALIVLIGLVVVPPIVSGVKELANEIPSKINDLQRAGWIHDLNRRYNVIDKLKQSAAGLPSQLGAAAGTLQSITFGAFSAFVELVTVLTLVFLMLLDGPRMVAWVTAQLPDERTARASRIADEIYRVVSGYVIGNLLISVAAGSVTYLTLTILGVPFAAPLSILMAFLDLIPLVGATIAGGLIALAAAALGDFPWDPIIWLIVLIAYQQVENNMLQPIIYRRTVAVPPLLTIVAVLIGAALLGVLGVLLAIPVAAMAQVIAKDLWAIYRPAESPDAPPNATVEAAGA